MSACRPGLALSHACGKKKNAARMAALRVEDFVSGAVEVAGAGFFPGGQGAAAVLAWLAARPLDGAHDPVARGGRKWQEVARGGFAAGILAEKFRPHVILLDMHLRDIDGREVAKHVKANPDLQLTKLIAMSGKMTDDEFKGLLASGFDGFLRKPFHVRRVIETIEDATAVVY